MKILNKHQNSPDDTAIPWSPLLAIFFVISAFFGASLLGELIVVGSGIVQGNRLEDIESWLTNPYRQFASMLLIYGIMALLILMFVKGNGASLSILGLKKPRFRDLGIALLGIVPYIMGYGILLAIASQVFPSLDLDQEQQLGFEPGGGAIVLLLTFVSLVILPPIVEELTMRGFLFTSLLKKSSFIVATLITSIIFAAAHLQYGSGEPLLWVAAIDTLILSVVLCYMRYKSGSLWPCIFLHGFKNLTAFLLIFVFKVV